MDELDIESMVLRITAEMIAEARKEILDYMGEYMIEHLRRQHGISRSNPQGTWACPNCGPR